MFIEESKLEKLLTKAYEEGWYGSKDCAPEAVGKIIADFANEQKSQEPKKPARKKAVKKKVPSSDVYMGRSRTISNSWIEATEGRARSRRNRGNLDHPMTFTTAGGERVTINDNSNDNANSYRAWQGSTLPGEGMLNDSISEHRAALEREMIDALRLPSGIMPINENALSPSSRPPSASPEMMEDVQAWVAASPADAIFNPNPCNEVDIQGNPIESMVAHPYPMPNDGPDETIE